MRTIQPLLRMTLLFTVTLILFTSCESIDQTPLDDPSIIAARSCNTISLPWINQLKTLAAVEFGTTPNELEVSAMEQISTTTYIYHSQNILAGRPAGDVEKFLLFVTHNGFEGEIIGYYDPTNLSFCTSPSDHLLVIDNVQNIVYATLGILGVDADSF